MALRHAAPTADEYSYISTAYIYVQTGDFRLDRTHPPLLRLLMGIPLQLADIHLPPLQQNKWDTLESNMLGYVIGWEMLLGGENDWRYLATLARLPILILSCGLAALLYVWAKHLYGQNGALISLFLYTFSPNILAHASLATMDLGVSFFFAASLFAVYNYWLYPNRRLLILTGLVFGLALAAKVTAILLFLPLLAGLLLAERKRYESWSAIPVKRFAVIPAVMTGCAFICLLFIYGFPFNSFYYFDTLENVIFKSTQTPGGEPVPGMPHTNYAFYLLGEYSTSGWFYYYLVAILVKTPLAVFGLLIFTFIWCKQRWNGTADILIAGTILLIIAASMLTRVNIGLRHVLPLYPLLFLYLGRAALIENRRIRGMVVPVFLLWYAAASIWISPHYLAYFNEAAGGPDNAHYILDDSNIDWGQDLAALKDVQAQDPNEPFYVATNWMLNPPAFGYHAERLRKEHIQTPPTGLVAVGIHWAIRQRIHERSPYYFDWLEQYEPIGHVGHSILLYRFNETQQD